MSDSTRDASAELRARVLRGKPSDFGLPQPPAATPVWAILMETAFPEGVFTLVSVSDGSASLYFSTGGGVIGGGEHDTVRAAALQFVRLANEYLPSMSPCTSFPLPGPGHTKFYVLTTGGVSTADALEEDLGEERHELSPLFYAAQDVITQIRLVTGDLR
jgi:hypothetical protein